MRRHFDSMLLLVRSRRVEFEEPFLDRDKSHQIFLEEFADDFGVAIDLAFEATISASLILLRWRVIALLALRGFLA
jgi:hypothetical protein